jgi:hypothetical protein
LSLEVEEMRERSAAEERRSGMRYRHCRYRGLSRDQAVPTLPLVRLVWVDQYPLPAGREFAIPTPIRERDVIYI